MNKYFVLWQRLNIPHKFHVPSMWSSCGRFEAPYMADTSDKVVRAFAFWMHEHTSFTGMWC